MKEFECEHSSPGVLECSCTHRLIPASDGLETSKEEGECSMPGKGAQGGNSLPPRRQCKSYMVKAGLPEAQFGRRVTPHSGARRVEKPRWIVSALARTMP